MKSQRSHAFFPQGGSALPAPRSTGRFESRSGCACRRPPGRGPSRVVLRRPTPSSVRMRRPKSTSRRNTAARFAVETLDGGETLPWVFFGPEVHRSRDAAKVTKPNSSGALLRQTERRCAAARYFWVGASAPETAWAGARPPGTCRAKGAAGRQSRAGTRTSQRN